MKPLISVVIPIYNVEKYLDRCIRSIVEQTYKNIEIILIDDGSSDTSSLICDKWKMCDDRIKVVHQINGGRGAARNAGVKTATGDFIGFVDGDDWIDANMYDVLVNDALQRHADIACCCFTNVFSKKNSEIDDPYGVSRIFSSKEALADMYQHTYGIWVSFCNKIIKKELFDNVSFPEDHRMFEDWSLAPMILYQAKTISYINRPYYFYDIHEEGSAMRSQTTKRHYDCVLGDLDHINYFKSLNVTEYDSKLKMYLSADYFKCSRCYTGSKEDKALLKDAYQKVKVIIPGFKTFCLYHFAGIIHLMSRIKHFIK